MVEIRLSALLLPLLGFVCGQTNLPSYKICVPHQVLEACRTLTASESQIATIECVGARDRMQCLERINQRKADFLQADPEDMYVAYNMKNEDFIVFSDIRTVEEAEAEFRYEGIILIHKNSNINSLHDLKGKRACHTGYGRNVGYKIPITKLKNHGVFKVPNDPEMSPVEKELKGLSELFPQACLVGAYSQNPEFNQILKKRYSNLCELCEHPTTCDYPDKYSGYNGAIKCLVENGGDLAFTKVIYVRRFFGLPIGNNPASTVAEANPADYEYLCEDGSRRPVTGKACSWAQRPWQGYMGNGDILQRLTAIQNRLTQFYDDAKQGSNKEIAEKMAVKAAQTVVDKNPITMPDEHLSKAQYKDVIERDGATDIKISLCVTSNVALKKCETMSKAAYSRDIRPQFECQLKGITECEEAVSEGAADAVVVDGASYEAARKRGLKALLFEAYSDDDVVVAVVDGDVKQEFLRKAEVNYDPSSRRSINAVLYFNDIRQKKVCPNSLVSNNEAPIRFVNAKMLTPADSIICRDLSIKPSTEFKTCNFEYTLPGAVFVRDTLSGNILDVLLHGFITLSTRFGRGGKLEDVFEMFGQFEEGANDVIFSDRAIGLVAEDNRVKKVDEAQYKKLHCLS